MSVANSIHHSKHIYNYLKALNLGLFLSDVYLNHLLTIILSVFLRGYRGKTVDFQEVSHCHRTTTAYFLNHGKWKDDALQDVLKSSIEAAYFHQSHLKGCQDYGHQVVSVMLSCNGITLNYAVILYDKSRSKIQIVQEIAEELPAAPVISYFLCDSWYTTAKVMDRFIRKGFYTVGALKTNRILYPCGIRQKASAFALHLRKTDPDVSLVTVGSREFYVYRYEGELNGIPNAAVILSYPKDGFGNPKALRVFLSTNAELSTQEILDTYTKRWPIELFFRQSKSKLALDSYQIRSRQGIQRYWLIMSLVHYLCCMHSGNYCTFEEGYASLKQQLKQEQFANLYRLIKSSASFEEAFKFVG